MRAERDEQITRPTKKQPERRLAYEIAIGIIIGGITLWVLEGIASMIAMKLALNQVQIHFGG